MITGILSIMKIIKTQILDYLNQNLHNKQKKQRKKSDAC